MPHFAGHYRQRGSGFGALAMGKAASELINIATMKKKTPKQVLKSRVKNTLRKKKRLKQSRKAIKKKTSTKIKRKNKKLSFPRNVY